MPISQDDAAISDLLNMKSRLERSIQELNESKEEAKKKVEGVRERKISLRKEKLDIYQRLYRAKISLVDLTKQTESFDLYFKTITDIYSKAEASIRDSTKLIELEDSIHQLNTNFERAINFYCDDSLQIELMKRTNLVRERRVEYTKLEQEFQDILRKLEAKRKEQEQRRLAELERAKQEEAQLRKLEEEKAREAEEQQRELFRNQLIAQRAQQQNQSFLGVGSSTELGQPKVTGQVASIPETFKSPILQSFPTKSNGDTGYHQKDNGNSKRCESPPESSFSQFLRWD